VGGAKGPWPWGRLRGRKKKWYPKSQEKANKNSLCAGLINGKKEEFLSGGWWGGVGK